MAGLSYPFDQDTSSAAAPAGSQVERIVLAVKRAIGDLRLAPDQRLPSIRAMAAEHDVSRDTVHRAYDKLVAGGHIYPRRGSGFYVAAPTRVRIVDVAPSPVDLDAFQFIHSNLPADRCPGSGVLQHDQGSIDEVARVLKGATSSGQRLGSYGDPVGYLPLREELQNKLRIDGVDVPKRSIITVPGCIAGLSLIVRAYVRHRMMVLVEDPSSFAHVAVMLAQGAEICRVPREPDGPDLEVLRTLCERHRPKIFLLSSLLQNPTGTNISLHKARKLLEIAAEFDLMLIDDAAYADLAPSAVGRPAVPLIVLDQLEHVIHVGGSSQTLTPEVGVGYIIAGKQHMNLLRVFRPVQGLGNMLIQERVLYRFLHDGLYRRRCERVRAYLAQRTTALRHLLASTPITLAPAAGGMFLWADLGDGVESIDIAKQMLAKGYLTAPGSHFLMPRTGHPFMRFNVTTTTAAATEALASCL